MCGVCGVCSVDPYPLLPSLKLQRVTDTTCHINDMQSCPWLWNLKDDSFDRFDSDKFKPPGCAFTPNLAPIAKSNLTSIKPVRDRPRTQPYIVPYLHSSGRQKKN